MTPPRYVMRELSGGHIGTRHGEREPWTSTFTILDSHYCYDVVFQVESGREYPSDGVTRLRQRVANFCERLNGPSQPCACEGCDNDLPVTFGRIGGLHPRIYCSKRCEGVQNQRNRRAREAARR